MRSFSKQQYKQNNWWIRTHHHEAECSTSISDPPFNETYITTNDGADDDDVDVENLPALLKKHRAAGGCAEACCQVTDYYLMFKNTTA